MRTEHVKRSVIEDKLLVALGDKNTVAILCSKEDLALLLRALSTLAHFVSPVELERVQEFRADLLELHVKAFGPIG